MLLRYTWVPGLLSLHLLMSMASASEPLLLQSGMRHLRAGEPREWAEFPETPDAERLEIAFEAAVNDREWSLRLRQQDVKQTWLVRLNGEELGRLHRDENDMVVYFAVPPGHLVSGANQLVVEMNAGGRASPDDIRVGQVIVEPKPLRDVLAAGQVEVTVLDEETGQPLPARITVLTEEGALQTVQAPDDPQLAVRPGTIYTAKGRARFGLPAGKYTVFAGRGFEYSLDSTVVESRAGETNRATLRIRREVPTDGYVACDTHIHSLTHSGHGDATVQERMVTIAAEGIELAIATDHNVQIDHDAIAREVGVREYFTPVIGNEVTTPVGHFNIFPVPAEAGKPDHRSTDWAAIFAEIERATGAPVVILNHARDLHSGVRPFGPQLFNSAVAERLDGQPLGFNAMEIINSGATQTDLMQLTRDWMALLNRGIAVTPVGSSDSHDVARHFVGQGRTYIRCDDTDPARIDVAKAVESMRQGRVMVSYGLLAELIVDGRGSGELVPVESETLRVDVRVLGPHWVTAREVELYANGELIESHQIAPALADAQQPGVKWSGGWTLPRPKHDVHLVAIARGPGVDAAYWKTAKPYQPVAPTWNAQVFACSGALWLDADAGGKQTSAREYAQRIWKSHDGDLPTMLNDLADYDSAVAAHVASLFEKAGGNPTGADFQTALRTAAPPVREGFRRYYEVWRENQTAGGRPAE